MLFQSDDASGGGRIPLRFVVALLIPAGLMLYLFFAAQTLEEAVHERNLRWLAQMATQISERVQIHSNFVRDRADHPSSNSTGADVQPEAYSIETLKPVSGADCGSDKNLTVKEDGQERWLLFAHARDGHQVCAKADLEALVKPAIRKDAFTSVVLAQWDGRVLYQSGPESLRITDVSFLFSSGGETRMKTSKSGASADNAATRGDAPTSS